MNIKEIEAKSLLRKHKKVDSWFISRYGMNLYRGCSHNCSYCDGRSEGYYVDGEFGKDVEVKINADQILRKELDPQKKRIPLKKGFIILGGGVGDSYQPADKKYEMSRKVLEVIHEFDFPVHVLTKSTLVKRDMDILKKINEKARAIVSFSFSSAEEDICSKFEPGLPSPEKRLETITYLKSEGISSGIFLLPVIPFISDTEDQIKNTVRKAKKAGADYIIFGGLTLKSGRQKDYFMNTVSENYPEHTGKYEKIYIKSKWGEPVNKYYTYIHNNFNKAVKKYNIPGRIPLRIFQDIPDKNDLVVLILEHIDYYLRKKGEKSPFGYAAYSISRVKEPISDIKGNLTKLQGIGKVTEKIVHEILETGTCSYYNKLTNNC